MVDVDRRKNVNVANGNDTARESEELVKKCTILRAKLLTNNNGCTSKREGDKEGDSEKRKEIRSAQLR